jgi:hypothetical protein
MELELDGSCEGPACSLQAILEKGGQQSAVDTLLLVIFCGRRPSSHHLPLS